MSSWRERISKRIETFPEKESEQIALHLAAMLEILQAHFGQELVKSIIADYEVEKLLDSDNIADRVMAMERIIYTNPDIKKKYSTIEEVRSAVQELEDALVEIIARNRVNAEIDAEVEKRMMERQQQYYLDIKKAVLTEKDGPETAYTEAKLQGLEDLERRTVGRSADSMVRPQDISEIVGQKSAVESLIASLASPFPQHILLYGAPGVGKTTTARLALQHAKTLPSTSFGEDAPFVEVDGATLRWDPRDIVNPLLGSVHDPIYQGAQRGLAEAGIPEPKLGLVSDASGGVLFIDEIGAMDYVLQNKLLKVMEDKRVFFESSYFDLDNPRVPEFIKKLFREGAPADFILIGATTLSPSQINPALRSRATEIFFDPLDSNHIREIVTAAAKRLGVRLDPQVTETIAEYAIEGRRAVNMLLGAYSMAIYEKGSTEDLLVESKHLEKVLQGSRMPKHVPVKSSAERKVGKIFGLAVYGFVGSVIEIECVAFPAGKPGEGYVRFNETAGSMAKDSVFNAKTVIRSMLDINPEDFDLHINVIGGGMVDGPSAGLAIALAIYSALSGKPLPQDIAVTGEISLQGDIKSVGGIAEKIYGARQAEVKRILVPRATEEQVPEVPNVEIVSVDNLKEALEIVFAEE